MPSIQVPQYTILKYFTVVRRKIFLTPWWGKEKKDRQLYFIKLTDSTPRASKSSYTVTSKGSAVSYTRSTIATWIAGTNVGSCNVQGKVKPVMIIP